MRRSSLRMLALLTALILLTTALPALADGTGTEYYMLSFQTGGYAYEAGLKTLYDNSLFSGVLFNGGKPFETTAPGRDALMGLLDAFKATPDADDIAYFHFVGTGYLKNGVAGIQLAGGDELPLASLASALSALPSRVCVLLDIKAAGVSPSAFNQQAKLAFSADKFQYLSACSATDAAFGGAPIPRATRILMTGFGLNPSTNALKAKNWPADANKNFSVSLKEAAAYLKAQSKKLKASDFNLALRMSGSGPNLYAFTGVTSLRLTVPSNVTTRDSSIAVQYTFSPTNADVFTPALTSSNPKVASVSGSGASAYLEINRPGTTTLTARSNLYPSPKATYKLKVAPVHTESVALTIGNQSVNGQTVEQKAGASFDVRGVVSPADSDFKEVYWKSDNPKVAVVERDETTSGLIGSVYCKKYGTAKITAYTKDGAEGSFTLVMSAVDIQGLYPPGDLKMIPGMSMQHGTSAYPEGVVCTISYKSSNPRVASVSSKGKVTAKKFGDAVITATCVQSPKYKVTYTIHVVPNAYTWAKPDAGALGEGVHYAPKSVSFSGKWLVGVVYIVNNTDQAFTGAGPLNAGVMENLHGPGEDYTNYVNHLVPDAPIAARGIGTYTFKIDKSAKLGGVLGKKLSSYILPWEQLVPFVAAPGSY